MEGGGRGKKGTGLLAEGNGKKDIFINEAWEKKFAAGKRSFDRTAGPKEKEKSFSWIFLKVPATTLVEMSVEEMKPLARENSLLTVSA